MTEEKIHVETSFSSLIKKNEELCGDKVAIRYCDQFCILVLADGLGSGVKANILSTLTSTIICEMMAEGSTLQEAVDTITATLPQCQERGIAYDRSDLLRWNCVFDRIRQSCRNHHAQGAVSGTAADHADDRRTEDS